MARTKEDCTCPICGVKHSVDTAHRCDPKKLRNIDRALNTEYRERMAESYHTRLSRGFAMLDDDDTGD